MTATLTREETSSSPTSRLSTFVGRHGSMMPTFAALGILVLLFIGGEAFLRGDFVTPRTISNLLLDNAYLLVLAVGMTFVILTGGIDLSVGSVMAFTGILGARMLAEGTPAWVAIPVMLLGGAVIGLMIGILVQYFNVQPFIATLSMMFLGRGLASILSTTPERLPDEAAMLALGSEIKLIDGPKVNDLMITPGVIIAVLVVLVAMFLLHRTRMGRTVYAIGGSEQSASLMGLPVNATKLWVYVISGLLAGIASVVYTTRLGIAQNITGLGWELDAIAAAVIGGTLLTGGVGSVLGSVVGALVLGLMIVLITRDGTVPPEATTIITGGILLVFVLLQRAVLARQRT